MHSNCLLLELAAAVVVMVMVVDDDFGQWPRDTMQLYCVRIV